MLIAFSGFKGSGKSTACQLLQDMQFIDVKMAGPLKAMLTALYSYNGLTDVEIYDRLEGAKKEELDEILAWNTPRYAMQTLGTEWRNMLDVNLWIPMWQRKVDKYLTNGFNVTCSDIRFPHEVSALKQRTGYLINLTRKGCVAEEHESEQNIAHLADISIDNNGTKGELREQIRKCFGQL